MKVTFGNIQIGLGGMEPVTSLVINGQQVNDPVQYYRALATQFVPRGLRSTSLQLTIERQFNTLRAARRFYHQHFSDLPQSGDLFLLLNESDPTDNVRYANAAIDSFAPGAGGISVQGVYNFSAGLPTFDEAPPDLTEPDDTMLKRGTTAIASGDDTVAVVFGTPFATTPFPTGNVLIPAGGDRVLCVGPISGTISAAGFTMQLSGPVPSSGYQLMWNAIA